jgi:DNA (cytosine-5)-methyltransferase 1
LRSSFRDYFDYILLQLRFPELQPKKSESWREHQLRLERIAKRPPRDGLRYNVEFQLLNAADFGVPQRRERVFIVAYLHELGAVWPGIQATHSEDALLYDKWVSGDYWKDHGLKRRPVPPALQKRVEKLWSSGRTFLGERWRTVRDTLKGLPEPKDFKEHPRFANHVGNPGARSYPGHDGSPWDEPAKTLKSGVHGVPGGENTLRREDGTVRYFTVREAARIQCFPDEYVFRGAWGEGFRQLGNAVPVDLACSVASSVRERLERPRLIAVA